MSAEIKQTIDLQVVENFLTPEECQALVKIAKPHLKKSGTLVKGKVVSHTSRTSSSAFLNFHDPEIYKVYLRAAERLGVDIGNFEHLQCTSYEKGEEYQAHFDAFRSTEVETLAKGQRTYTTLIYLNDDFTGGETGFPRLDLKVEPAIGKAVIWNSLQPNGLINPQSLHAGLPVTSGQKVVANLWLRDKFYVEKGE